MAHAFWWATNTVADRSQKTCYNSILDLRTLSVWVCAETGAHMKLCRGCECPLISIKSLWDINNYIKHGLFVCVCVEMLWRGLMGNIVFNWFQTWAFASVQNAEQQEAAFTLIDQLAGLWLTLFVFLWHNSCSIHLQTLAACFKLYGRWILHMIIHWF